ncbi:CPBP family intramembrane glutamic endopeptidase [Limibacter armeniacum]|uniref:CPBP family intramembrane glutamic endopeptidase n=1 Tax=Limibacter armeniacum TaxID=466084 RepID=UPI002FE66108
MEYKHIDQQTQNPFLQLVKLVIYIIGGLFVGQFLAYGMLLPIYQFDFNAVNNMITAPMSSPDVRIPYLMLQACMSISMFGLAPMAFWHFSEEKSLVDIWTFKESNWPILCLLGGAIAIAAMPLGTYLGAWNQSMHLPESLSLVEEYMRETEDRLGELTKFLLDFESTGQFLVGLIVIAVLPGLLEELLFRGILQNILHRYTRNIHWAIWISAFVFAAIHFQFYGFLPRMVLGALFGYLYFWSGKLIVPIFAHFLNNAYTVTAFYLKKDLFTDQVDFEQVSTPPVYVLLISVMVLVALLFTFYKSTVRSEEQIHQQ